VIVPDGDVLDRTPVSGDARHSAADVRRPDDPDDRETVSLCEWMISALSWHDMNPDEQKRLHSAS
jgi:hypothetical protein